MDWLSVLTNLAKFASALMQFINTQRDYTNGWTGAVSSGLQISAQQMQAANDEMQKASETHAHDNTDGAFDQDFKRDNP